MRRELHQAIYKATRKTDDIKQSVRQAIGAFEDVSTFKVTFDKTFFTVEINNKPFSEFPNGEVL